MRPVEERGLGSLAVVAKADRQVRAIDLDSGETRWRADLSGATGHEVVASRDARRLLVPIYSDAALGAPGSDGRTIDVIDAPTGTLLRTVDVGGPVRPHGIVVGPAGRVYVTAENIRGVLVLGGPALREECAIPTGAAGSHMIALSADGLVACTANATDGSVSIIDARGGVLRAVVPVARRVNRICVSPDGAVAYTCDQEEPRVAVIDVRRQRVRSWIPLSDVGFAVALTDAGRLVVALRWAAAVAIVDPDGAHPTQRIDVPDGPQAVAVHTAGDLAYVSCGPAGAVAELDLRALRVRRILPAGGDPDGLCLYAPGDDATSSA